MITVQMSNAENTEGTQRTAERPLDLCYEVFQLTKESREFAGLIVSI